MNHLGKCLLEIYLNCNALSVIWITLVNVAVPFTTFLFTVTLVSRPSCNQEMLCHNQVDKDKDKDKYKYKDKYKDKDKDKLDLKQGDKTAVGPSVLSLWKPSQSSSGQQTCQHVLESESWLKIGPTYKGKQTDHRILNHENMLAQSGLKTGKWQNHRLSLFL